MKNQYLHKKSKSILELIKRCKNNAIYYVMNEDGSHKRTNHFNSNKTYKTRALCRNCFVEVFNKKISGQGSLF